MLEGPKVLPNAQVRSAVIFLHGYGADGADLLSLSSVFKKDFPHTAFFAPNGPAPTNMGVGRQWFSDANGTFRDRPGLDKAVKLLEDYLEKEVYAPHGLLPKDVVLVGFSVGTMVALHGVPHFKKPVAGVVGFSGALMFAASVKAAPQKSMPVLLIHGLDDDVVPFQATELAATTLDQQGYQVQTQFLAGLGHGIDERGIRLAGQFFKGIIS